jgi:hypothetical protein
MNLFAQTNKNTGDVIVTNDSSSMGTSFKRTLGVLPPTNIVSLFMANTSGSKGDGSEIFQIDVQANFQCTMALLTIPATFALYQVFINEVPMSVPTFLAGVPISPRATMSLFFENIGLDVDALFSGAMTLTIP